MQNWLNAVAKAVFLGLVGCTLALAVRVVMGRKWQSRVATVVAVLRCSVLVLVVGAAGSLLWLWVEVHRFADLEVHANAEFGRSKLEPCFTRGQVRKAERQKVRGNPSGTEDDIGGSKSPCSSDGVSSCAVSSLQELCTEMLGGDAGSGSSDVGEVTSAW
jgi:hypothetical protein